MSSYLHNSWRIIFKDYLASARVSILRQVLLDELHMNIDPNSKILMSNIDTAIELLKLYAEASNKEASLPHVVVAQQLTEANSQYGNDERLQTGIRVESTDQLGENKFTHAFLHVHTDKSERDILDLLRQVYQLLGPNGKLVLSRRKRDGFAEILHAAGMQVPGRQQGSNVSTPSDQDDGLAALVAEAGFPRSEILRTEKSHLTIQFRSDAFLVGAKSALVPNLGSCDEGAGWKAAFDDAANREIAEHGGVLLTASVVVATKYIAHG